LKQLKRITILGGTGFLGHALATSLTRQGYQLRIPTRHREAHRDLLVLPGVELVQTDPYDKNVLKDALQGSDAVINMIGILFETRSVKHKFLQTQVELTQSALRLCEELGVNRFIHISALKAHAQDAPSEYLKSKGMAESLVSKSSINSTIFRPSVMFGEHDSFVNRFAKLLRLPGPWFFLPVPNARFAPVHVGDVVKAISISLKDRSTFNKRYSCCGPKIYSMREIISLISKTLGIKKKIIGLGPLLSRMMARLLGILPGKPFTMDNYHSLQVNNICEDNDLVKLGINPVRLDSMISSCLTPRDNNTVHSRLRRIAGRT
jgi:NADH dehydrogenase